jgi:putative aminopeptidase FrvX
MTSSPLLAIIRSIVSQPTAPFCEDAVRAEIRKLLAACPHVTTEIDSHGNLTARYRRGRRSPRFALAAHMDHPGFVDGEFLGGVPERYRKKHPPIRSFGRFAMWDLPECEIRAGRIFSRACDDLIGCAAIVATLHELERTDARAALDALFTRGEEVGFAGAIALARSGTLSRRTQVISIECSSEKGGLCKMGDGVIVRVGDRTSIFDPAITAHLCDLAAQHQIPAQRCLMSGGTCEATAFQLYGYACGALCVALGNYHNCGPRNRIAPEMVSVRDVRALVQLCTALARSDGTSESAAKSLRQRLNQRVAKFRTLLTAGTPQTPTKGKR